MKIIYRRQLDFSVSCLICHILVRRKKKHEVFRKFMNTTRRAKAEGSVAITW